MRSYDCPQCGAAVAFQSSVTVFAVCGHCRSMVVRRDVNVELLGLQAELPPDLSPLQVGTRGEFDGQSFTLLGRVRIRYHEGSWNEWLANFGEDRWGWVAEAQGFYMVSFEVPVPDDFPGLVELRASATPDARTGIKLVNFGLSVGRENLPVGHELTLTGVKYSVRDSKQTEVISSEGELTFAATPGRAAISADLGGPGNAFANAEYSDDGIRLFVGRYCRFGELKLTELRPVPGWTAESFEPTRGQSSALSCPNCGATVSLRAAGLTMAAVCGSCGSLIDTSDPKLQLIDTAERRQVFHPKIPLGRRGTLHGTEFECIGFMRRRDQSGDAWFEYLLFNPFAGFRWLVTYQGHWSFVDQLLEQPDWSGGDVEFGGESYRLFATGRAEVSYVLGEFYWKVRVRERTEAADFIRPPFILSREAYPDLKEVTWSHGEYLAPAEVQAAFKLEEPLSEPRGAYLNQPNPHSTKGRSLRRWVPLFAVVLVIVQLVSAVRSGNEVVYRNTLTLRTGETNQLDLGKVFRVKGGVQPVEVSVYAPVDNSWVELELDLVNATNQQARSFTVPVEYYHGWDDGSWSEGSQKRSTLLTSVEPGDYFLAAELAAADSSITEIPVEIVVTRDVTVWSNFWLGLVALMAYPCYRWLREHAFERARWALSDFSPYAGSASDDDDDDGNGIDLGGDD